MCAAPDLLFLLLEQVADDLDLPLRPLFEIPQVVLEAHVVGDDLQPDHRLVGHLLQHVWRELGALLEDALAAVLVEQI